MSNGRHRDVGSLQVSDAVRRLNPGLFAADSAAAMAVKTGVMAPAKFLRTVTVEGGGKPKRRLRQDTKGPNKTEAEFERWLREEWRNKEACVTPQGVNLWLANGVRYCPDFVLAITRHRENGTPWIEVHAYETKGFMRDDAAVKIKVAAHQYPWIKFHLVTKRGKKDGGGWDIEEVLP